MKPLSASQAVWPALERTSRFLFRPFASGRFLKLAAAADLSEGALVSFKFATPHALPVDSDLFDLSKLPHLPGFTFFAVAAAVASVLIGLIGYYLVLQLRFAFFHCLLDESSEIATAWKLGKGQVDRFFKGSLKVWFTLLLVAVAAVGFVVAAVYALFTVRTPDGKLDPGVFLFLFFPSVGIAILLLILGLLAEVVMHDFILPRMALAHVTFKEAWKAALASINAERERFFSYLLLRLLLQLFGGLGLAVVALVVGLAAFGILGTSAMGFNAMLDDASGFLAALRLCLDVLFVALGLGIGFVIAVSLGGPLGVFMRSYAMYFYGGYLQVLGDRLAPPLPPAVEGSQGVH